MGPRVEVKFPDWCRKKGSALPRLRDDNQEEAYAEKQEQDTSFGEKSLQWESPTLGSNQQHDVSQLLTLEMWDGHMEVGRNFYSLVTRMRADY